jgi:hypothetical protein
MLMVLQRLGLLCLLCVLFLWAVPSQAGRAYPPEPALFDHTHADWAKLLLRAVHTDQGGSVSKLDYQVFLDDKHAFENYLKALSAVSVEQFKGFSRSEQLAFLLNAYNSFMVAKIMTRYPGIASVWDFGRVLNTPFKHRFFDLLGKRRSLDDIEHRLIRGDSVLMDPRIHFAVNCASVGCPALRGEPFLAPRLGTQLEDQTIRFLNDRNRNYYDGESERLFVSPLFDWYGGDFKPPKNQSPRNVIGFLLHYAAALGLSGDQQKRLAEGKVTIDYSNYDWRLNAVTDAQALSESE